MIDNIGVYQDRDKYLRECRRQMGRLNSLVKEILEISKMSSDIKPNFTQFGLHEIISTVISNHLAIAEKRGVSIKTDLFPVSVQADKVLLEKAISNVLSNAINNTRPKKSVEITLEDSGDKVILRVINEGPKIEGDIERLFEPFSRADLSRSSNTGGSGLGLYIVKQALTSMQMPYHLLNIEAGACFEMIIPIA